MIRIDLEKKFEEFNEKESELEWSGVYICRGCRRCSRSDSVACTLSDNKSKTYLDSERKNER